MISSVPKKQEQRPYLGRENSYNNDLGYFGNYDQISTGTTYEKNQDSLLSLVLGVHSYLSEVAEASPKTHESPLFGLQYKVYMYLKQREQELGLDSTKISC
ncbi:hypothetical protein BDF14DRAFT_1764113 [Spinellus fusiger]|nr:hypothetical protein BDF14DRAFT_1764113 [Spinellus fusiger]